MIFSFPTPADFRFRATVESHGWYQLAPYAYDAANAVLNRPVRLKNGDVVTLKLYGDALVAEADSEVDAAEIQPMVNAIFRLDHDLSAFYEQMAQSSGYEWVNEQKAGRIMASPTIWEDLAKTLLTTNTSWGNTKSMVKKLASIDPHGIFPSPEEVAALSPDEFAAKAGAGYRNAYLYGLAQNIANGTLDVESWKSLDTESLYQAVRGIKGFGDYAAGSMLRLLGHYDRLAIDSVARDSYKRVTGESEASDKAIIRYYEPYGDYRGLVQWMDCIKS
jgi:3-methyladenine DNA glycosylase/8-oxoguanine DNA glycosylase